MAVVNNLKTIRESRGLLQEDIASATGFCTKTISRVERGERAPSAEFMLRIAAYFNLFVEDVFKLEEHLQCPFPHHFSFLQVSIL